MASILPCDEGRRHVIPRRLTVVPVLSVLSVCSFCSFLFGPLRPHHDLSEVNGVVIAGTVLSLWR
jgi:hypothetical protein